jgi:hypothetical protein
VSGLESVAWAEKVGGGGVGVDKEERNATGQ